MNGLMLVLPAVSQAEPNTIQSKVCANTAATPAPSSFTDPLYVEVPHRPTFHYPPFTDWPACHGSTLPDAGDVVLLEQDYNKRKWWVARWEGTTVTSPVQFAPAATGTGAWGLVYVNYSASTFTITLPAVKANQMIGFVTTSGNLTVKTANSSGAPQMLLAGTASNSVTVASSSGMLLLISDGVNYFPFGGTY